MSKSDATSASITSSGFPSTRIYSVIETHLSTGDIVREYVLPGNRVFAVTWSGRGQPDLAALLGSIYFREYQTALAGC
ncbi:DUF2844 domain-containing protein [Burkholderia ubonensis]|uniref:DUF2844 domain-containing protein n=1 Tax=Burkholderia ubonensis TaxID=101571 RepID=UPI0034E975D4